MSEHPHQDEQPDSREARSKGVGLDDMSLCRLTILSKLSDPEADFAYVNRVRLAAGLQALPPADPHNG